MRIHKLIISNFLSFGEEVEVDFSQKGSPILIKGDNRKMVDTDSSNGSGKSSLFEAFYWALAGKTMRGVAAGAVIRHGCKKAKVVATFSFRDREYQVERVYSANTKTLTLLIDGEHINFHDAKQATEDLFQTLEIEAQHLLLACFYSTHIKTVSQMTPGERAKLIEVVANTERWANAAKVAAAKNKEESTKLEFWMQKVDELTQRKKKVEQEEEQAQNSIRQMEAQMKQQKEEMQGKLDGTKQLLQTQKALLSAAEVSYEQAIKAQEDANQAIKAQRDEEVEILTTQNKLGAAAMATPIMPTLDAFTRTVTPLRDPATFASHIQLKSQEALLVAAEAKLSDFETQQVQICPTCNQPIVSAEVKKSILLKYKKEVDDIETSLFSLRAQLELEVDEEQSRFNSQHEAAKEQYAQAMRQYEKESADAITVNQNIKEQQAALDARLEILRQEMSAGEEAADSSTRAVATIVENRQKVSDAIHHYETEVRQMEVQMENMDNDADLVRLKTVLDAKKEEKETLRIEIITRKDEIAYREKYRDAYAFWQEGFKNIRFSLFDGALATFEHAINHFCRGGGLEFSQITVESSRKAVSGKTINDVTISIHRDEEVISASALSDGEAQRFNIACFLAVHSMIEAAFGYKLEMAVLDEPMSGIDYDGRNRIFSIIQEMAKERQVLVVDHDANFQELFYSVITVRKDEFSTIQ